MRFSSHMESIRDSRNASMKLRHRSAVLDLQHHHRRRREVNWTDRVPRTVHGPKGPNPSAANQPRKESAIVSAKPLSTIDVQSVSCGVSSTSVSLSTVIASPYFRFKAFSIGRSAASPDNVAAPDVLEAAAPDVAPDAADNTAADAATMAAQSGQATVSDVCLHTGMRWVRTRRTPFTKTPGSKASPTNSPGAGRPGVGAANRVRSRTPDVVA